MPVHVIAEMACSHEGRPELARSIIDAAAVAGADSIQFQIWLAEGLAVPHHASYPLLERVELSRADWRMLAEYCRSAAPDLERIACVYEADSVDFCETLEVVAYKVHCSDITHPQLLKRIARTGKRVHVSTGASTLVEIQQALAVLRHNGCGPVTLMYGYQSHPTPADAVHLAYMARLGQLFDLPVGYQDHSAGGTGAAFWLPAAAIGMGAVLIEKHITHERREGGVDADAALNPDEFGSFVTMVRTLEGALGTATPRALSEPEIAYRRGSRKSIVAARDLSVGTRLRAEDLYFLRATELGLAPAEDRRLLGRPLNRDVCAFESLREQDVE